MSGTAVRTLAQFVDRVLAYFSAWAYAGEGEPELWFRGLNDADLQLLPGAYWRKDCDELSLFVGFQNLAPMYLAREPLDEWDWYYVMQHYGLPTRLLDWSESPLAALYFALEFPKPGVEACVWVLDPLALNRLTLSWRDGFIVAPGDQDTKNWLPTHCGRHRKPTSFLADGVLKSEDGSPSMRDNRKPLAIFARRSSPRIVAQRGVFTVHGSDETPIDSILSVDDVSGSTRLEKILIDPNGSTEILRGLRALGVNKSTLFPEAQSISEDLKRLYRISV